jgi:hypothetical protein
MFNNSQAPLRVCIKLLVGNHKKLKAGIQVLSEYNIAGTAGGKVSGAAENDLTHPP